jgi:hypothetical protein
MKTIEDTRQPEDSAPNQTINAKLCDGTILIGYGKPGHGMNGKDADLDRIGQCLVTSLETVDPIGADNLRVDINLRLYVSICAPSYDGIDFEKVKNTDDPMLREFFKDHLGVDLAGLDVDDDSPETEEQLEKIVEFYRAQAEGIVCGMNATPDDPFAIMWNDDAWEGGIDVTLSVPLTVDEYEEIEAGNQETLDTIAARIAAEIYAGNEGGTPERDRMKLWEEEIGLCNDMIAQLGCY